MGTGGQDLQKLLGKAPYVVTQFERYGFLNIDITENGKKLVGSFYENGYEDPKDNFSITNKLPVYP